MTSCAKDTLSKEFRQTEPDFPLDVINLIYDFLPTHKLVDEICNDQLEHIQKTGFPLQWVDKELWKEYPKKILQIVKKYFYKDLDDFLIDYCMRNFEPQKSIISELSSVSPIPFEYDYFHSYLIILLETKHEKKLSNSRAFYDTLEDWLDYLQVGKGKEKEIVLTRKYQGEGTHYEHCYSYKYFLFQGEKTLSEIFDFIFLMNAT
jgi:hypothetical protein